MAGGSRSGLRWRSVGSYVGAGILLAGLVVGPDAPHPSVAQAAGAANRVELLGLRTEASQTFKNPDGSFTLEQSAQPVRTKRNGAWIDLDPTVERSSDGQLRPRATSIDMAFSGGGSSPLVTLGYDGEQMSLRWPRPLPAPVVVGDTITYGSVFPDVDLKITVSTTSFAEVLVVRTPQAADLPDLSKISLAVDAPRLNLRRTAGGGLEAIDKLGRAVFQAPKPTMWDSRGDGKVEPPATDRTEAPLEGDRVVAMPIEVSQQTIAVTPSAALADDPATVYPLHIDPPITGAQSGRAMINQHHSSTSTWNWMNPEGVGYQAFEPWSRKRLFFQFLLPGQVAGAVILGATLSVFETWAASCTPKEVQAWKTVRFGENTTWDSGAGSNVWLERLSSLTAAHGRDGCDPGGMWLAFPVGAAVSDMVAVSSKYVYLGLRAADESDQYAWKRFRADPRLAIHYNHPPTVTSRAMNNPDGICATSAAAPSYIGTREPVPVIEPADIDSDAVTADFELYRVGESQPRWRGQSATKVPDDGIKFTPTTPLRDYVVSEGYLTAGVTWAWRARVRDGLHASAWTSFCYFWIDVTRPPPPKIIVLTTGELKLSQPITIRLEPNGATDVVKYRVGLNDDVPTSGDISATSPTYTFTPSVIGPYWIYGWSVDRVGNQSDRNKVEVRIVDGEPIGRWAIDEGSGSTLADSSGRNHPMYASSTTAWSTGNRWPDQEDRSVSMNGLGDTWARTAANDVIDTSLNFSVTARVRVGLRSVRQSAVSEDRPGMSGFTLGVYAQRWSSTDINDRDVIWEFAVPDPDGSGEIVARTGWMAYQPGEWVHLAGTYDAASDLIRLFVNGTPMVYGVIGNGRRPLDADGALKIGQGIGASQYNYFFLGQLDDVRIFDGRISDASVRAVRLAD